MGLDLRLVERRDAAMPAAPPAPRVAAADKSAHAMDELWQAHQMLAHNLSEIWRQQGEAQERTIRQGFANLERHSAETADRYRTLVDELGRRAASGPSLGRLEWLRVSFNATMVGLVLGATLAMWAPHLWRRVQPWVVPAIVLPAATKPAPLAVPPAPSKPARPKVR
jgi:hypothetical protein